MSANPDTAAVLALLVDEGLGDWMRRPTGWPLDVCWRRYIADAVSEDDPEALSAVRVALASGKADA